MYVLPPLKNPSDALFLLSIVFFHISNKSLGPKRTIIYIPNHNEYIWASQSLVNIRQLLNNVDRVLYCFYYGKAVKLAFKTCLVDK